MPLLKLPSRGLTVITSAVFICFLFTAMFSRLQSRPRLMNTAMSASYVEVREINKNDSAEFRTTKITTAAAKEKDCKPDAISPTEMPSAIHKKQANGRDLHYPLMLYEGFKGFASAKEPRQILGAYEGVANIVSFIWCGKNRLFEFKHMLSVLSALKVQQPLKVNLFYWPGSKPQEDLYNSWLSELKETFFNFKVSKIPHDIQEPVTCADTNHRANTISSLIKSMPYGGIFMDENILLQHPVDQYRKKDTVFFRSDTTTALVIGRNITLSQIIRPMDTISCVSHDQIAGNPRAACLSMEIETLYPRDIMTKSGAFERITRKLFYGSEEVKEPRFSLSDPIPNIGHFYLLGENKISFFIYLSIYSMISVLQVDTVYLHGDYEPTGHFWEKLLKTEKIKFIFCPPMETIFSNTISSDDKFHGKDILSVYFLYLYGGVFIDWDAIFTKPLDDAVRGYEVVLGYDWFIPEESPTFPEVINPGVIAAKPYSVFISMWLEKYKEFGQKGGFYYTGLLVPYKLYERYPETVKLDKKFQVICWKKTCHPPWMEGYNRPAFHSEFNWQNVYSVHFTFPDPHEFYTINDLRNSSSMIAQMGQKVMGWT
ncbi:uncharacterized protein [Watersipora subatra]|uniref:uncharacterized protein n=1 Tax=Watersipora subatra TaxID=2589382 RepID=UPI00355B17F8